METMTARLKYKSLHVKLFRDVKKEFLSSLSIVLLIAIGIGAYSAPVAGWISLSENIEKVYENYNFEDVHVQFLRPISRSRLNQILSSSNQSILNQLWLNARLVIDASLLLKNDAGEIVNKVQLRLIGINLTERILSFRFPDRYHFINDVFIFNGKMLAGEDVGTRNLVLDPRLAVEYGISISQEIAVNLPSNRSTEITLIIKGLGSNPEYIIPLSSLNDLPASSRRFGVAFISLKTLQEISGASDKVNDLVISLKKDATLSRDQVVDYFQKIFKENGILIFPPYTREYQTSNHILWLDLRAINRIGTRYPLYLLLIGVFGVYLILSRRVKHQRRFIGLALASGYSRRDLFIHYLEHAYLLGSLGTALGIVGGWILSQVVIRIYTHRLAVPTLTTSFPPELLLISIPVGVISITVAALHPAWKATRLTPRECLQDPPQLTVKVAKKSFLEKMVTLFFPKVGVGTKMALRNLRRSLGRTLTAIIAVSLALSMFISNRSLLDSGYYTVETFYGAQNVKWDAMIQFYGDSPVTDDFLDQLLSIKEIENAELTFEIPVLVDGLTAKTSSVDMSLDVFDLIKLPEPRADFIYQNENANRSSEGLYLVVSSLNASLTMPSVVKGNFSTNGIVISEQFAQSYGLKLGDNLTITVPRIIWGTIFGIVIPVDIVQQKVSLVISGFSREFTSFMGYLDVKMFRDVTDWRSLPLYNRAYITVSAGINREALRKKVFQTFPSVKTFEYQEELQEGFQEVLNLMNVVVNVLSFFSTLLGLVLIVSILLVSIIERHREIATMEVLGASRSFILKTLFLEYLIIGGFGVLIGIFLGYVIGFYFFSLIGTELFQGVFYISMITYQLSVISAFFMIVSSVILVAQVIFRQPLVESTKTFS